MRTVRAVRQALYVFYGVVGNSYTPPVECLSHHLLGNNGLDVFVVTCLPPRASGCACSCIRGPFVENGCHSVSHLLDRYRSVVRGLALVVALVIDAGVTHESCSSGVKCLAS